MDKILNLVINGKDGTKSAFNSIATSAKQLGEEAHHSIREFRHIAVAVEGGKIAIEGAKAALSGYRAVQAYLKGDTAEWSRQLEEVDKSMKALPLGIGEAYSLGQSIRDLFSNERNLLEQQNIETEKQNKLQEVRKKLIEEIHKIQLDAKEKTEELNSQSIVDSKIGDDREMEQAKQEFEKQKREIEKQKKDILTKAGEEKVPQSPESLKALTKPLDDELFKASSVYNAKVDTMRAEISKKVKEFMAGNSKEVTDLATQSQVSALQASGDIVAAQKARINQQYDDLVTEAQKAAEKLKNTSSIIAGSDVDDSTKQKTDALNKARQAALDAADKEGSKVKDQQALDIAEKLAELQKSSIAEIDTGGNLALDKEKQKLILAQQYKEKQIEIQKILDDVHTTDAQKSALKDQLKLLDLTNQSAKNKIDLLGIKAGTHSATEESRFGNGAVDALTDPASKQNQLTADQLKEQKEQTTLFRQSVALLQKLAGLSPNPIPVFNPKG